MKTKLKYPRVWDNQLDDITLGTWVNTGEKSNFFSSSLKYPCESINKIVFLSTKNQMVPFLFKVTRLISVAAQKFVADIAYNALQVRIVLSISNLSLWFLQQLDTI